MLPDDTIAQILAAPDDDLQMIVDLLVDAANDVGGLDNVTALLVKLVEQD